jgi:hypothetical protein
MSFTEREWWTVIHGMLLGAAFLLAFAGGLAGLYSLRPHLITAKGLRDRVLRLRIGTTVMAIVAWLTVITGTWVVYPWYREDVPDSPRSLLRADPAREAWHSFGMEWKEHVAWISPILATVVAFIVIYYGAGLVKNNALRRAVIVLFTLAFLFAAIAGALGAFITKAEPLY